MDSNEFIKPLIPYKEYEKKYHKKKILFDCGAFSWIKTSIFGAASGELVAETMLNSATLKDSYAKYAEEAQVLGKPVS